MKKPDSKKLDSKFSGQKDRVSQRPHSPKSIGDSFDAKKSSRPHTPKTSYIATGGAKSRKPQDKTIFLHKERTMPFTNSQRTIIELSTNLLRMARFFCRVGGEAVKVL